MGVGNSCKMRVYMLAKELGIASKELLLFLASKKQDLSSHMSGLSEKQVALVKSELGAPYTKKELEAKKLPKSQIYWLEKRMKRRRGRRKLRRLL